MELLQKNKWLIAVLVIVFSLLFCYIIWLNSLFSCAEIDNKRCVSLYEKYTQTKFPKSGTIIKKDNLCGLYDGWEAAAIEVSDKNEFQVLKREVKNKPFISSKLKKDKVGYFGSGIQRGFNATDTIVNNYEKRFVLEFISDKQIIIFEKTW